MTRVKVGSEDTLRLDTLHQFFTILHKGDNFLSSYLLFYIPRQKESRLKGKNLLPIGSKFFSFRVDSFSEGAKTDVTELSPLEVHQFLISRPQRLNSCTKSHKTHGKYLPQQNKK